MRGQDYITLDYKHMFCASQLPNWAKIINPPSAWSRGQRAEQDHYHALPLPALPALMEHTVAIITQLKMTHLLQFIKFFCCNDKEVHNRCPDLPYDIMTSSQCHHVMTTRTDIFINPSLVVGIKSHFNSE